MQKKGFKIAPPYCKHLISKESQEKLRRGSNLFLITEVYNILLEIFKKNILTLNSVIVVIIKNTIHYYTKLS